MIKAISIAFILALTLTACQLPPKNQLGKLPVALNQPVLPYAVGSQTVFVHDSSRPYDSVGGVDVGIRSLITEIWYPVEHRAINSGDYQQATYGDYVFGDRDIHRLMMTQTTFFHLTPDTVVAGTSQADIELAIDELFSRKRNSFINAPLSASQASYPVLVMTHGDAGSRYNMESASEYLAAHGYIVIAPEHTGNSPFSLTAKDPEIDDALAAVKPFLNADGSYGSVEKYGQTYTPLISGSATAKALVQLDDALLQRVGDLRAVLKELDRMNSIGMFADRLNLSSIGLFGRSFGGTTTLAALTLESRFTAGAAVVPLVLPDVRALLPTEFRKPKGTESVILNASGIVSIEQINKPTMLLSGAEDSLIIGVGAALAESFSSELPLPTNPLPVLRKSYEDSQAPVIWGLLEDSNHGSFGVSGPYWWPELKPKSKTRFFAPHDSFDLVSSNVAHDIQRKKLLQFFDVMIKGKAEQQGVLLQNQFLEQGLQYEFRNFK
ncbi:MAG: dienelactone hydrolase [Arenicella sp.]|jgi:dienelactone hydrolase